jgi:hypothetical protein
MSRKSILAGCLSLALTACGSGQPQSPESGGSVLMMEQAAATELKAEVGGTILKLEKTTDQGPSSSAELKYLGLAGDGRIKLRISSTDQETDETWRRCLTQAGYATSPSGPVEFEQDPAEAFALEGFEVELIEAQASWIRYRITSAAGGDE